MQQAHPIISLFFIFVLLIAIVFYKYHAIEIYKTEEASPHSNMAFLGEKYAMGRSMRFSILYISAILVCSCIIGFFGLRYYILMLSLRFDILRTQPAILFVSGVVFFPLILLGLTYVSMTDNGLSWWDAFIISFRFDSFHGKSRYLSPILENLIEEAQNGTNDPHRAFLTIQRLFNHRFELGRVTRRLLFDMDPDLFHDLEVYLIEESLPKRKSRLLFVTSVISILIAFASSVLFVFGITPELFLLLFDITTSLAFVLILVGVITLSLELPRFKMFEYKPEAYEETQSDEREAAAT
ncbi:MAG: hypothetical protein ACFFED_09780 [Candidatus Thorarchaeota archaeon]